MKPTLIAVITVLSLSGTLHAQNNLIPEFTVDGFTKTLRETTGSEVITATQTSSVNTTRTGYEATLTYDFANNEGSLVFDMRIINGELLDYGNTLSTASGRIERTAITPLSESVLSPVLDQTANSTGEYTLKTFNGGQEVSSFDSDYSQQTTYVAGFESVTVPAGTFDNAVKVVIVETIEQEPFLPVLPPTVTTLNITNWIANGVGLIKSVEKSTEGDITEITTTELISYSSPVALPTNAPQLTNGGTALPLLDSAPSPPTPKQELNLVFNVNGISDVPGGAGFYYSLWLEFFYGDTYPWIYHFTLGWLYINPGSSESNSNFTMYSPDLGWLYTNQSLYPSLYSFDRSEWLYYIIGSDPRSVIRL